jgi:tyrosinase
MTTIDPNCLTSITTSFPERLPGLTALVEGDPPAVAARLVHVEGLDRSKLRGSFIISAFAEVDGKMTAIGHEAALSRWQVAGCANCVPHLKTSVNFPLPVNARATTEGTTATVQVRVTTRHQVLRSRESGMFAKTAAGHQPLFTVELR